MRRIDYSEYLDKTAGCFAGKAAIGTLGAPYEGVKMDMRLSYDGKMTDEMLPNDDLDLQILWLDVVKRYGADFTSRQLLQRFCEYCDYSPGEYAVMRKNHECGIYPPYSGMYKNHFYREGMGCPIRSEIWACLAPGDPELAAEYAGRDGILDHAGESVYAEKFFAACEAEAFFESDLHKLFSVGLSVIPEDCKFAGLVKYTVDLCKKYSDIKTVRAFILDRYGHPDCTNMFQNMGITIASLLLCRGDPIETGMAALNCGFDTDCTCASAGALLGLILGGRRFSEKTGLYGLKYVLSVRADPRGDTTDELSSEIARLGAALPHVNTEICGAPGGKFDFAAPDGYAFEYIYDTIPCVTPERSCGVTVRIKRSGRIEGKLTLVYPGTLSGEEYFDVSEENEADVHVSVSAKEGTKVFPLKNIIKVRFDGAAGTYEDSFGVCCAAVWRADGPIWRTDPVIGPYDLADGKSYWSMMKPGKDEGENTDNVRDFHLNFARDTKTPYLDVDELFESFEPGFSDGRIKRYYYGCDDMIKLSDISSFKGPCVFYLSQKMICDEEKRLYIQLGRSAPYELYLNGELLSRRDDCDTFTSENVHISGVTLKKGENRLVLRLTQINEDSTFSIVFSYGATCSRHFTDIKTKLF